MIFAVTASEPRGLAGLVREFWPLLLPTALGFLGLYLLLPRVRRSRTAWSALLAGGALALLIVQLARIDAIWQEQFVLLAAILCVLERNYQSSDRQVVAEKLERVVQASDAKEAYAILGEPAKEAGSRTLNSFPELGKVFHDEQDEQDVDVLNLEGAW